MDRETLYKFFEGAASYEEEVRIRQWMEHSPENRREFLKERKIFDSMLLLGDEKTIEEKMRQEAVCPGNAPQFADHATSRHIERNIDSAFFKHR